jgi:hypothetical protein
MNPMKIRRVLAMHPIEFFYRSQKEFRTWQQRMDPERTIRLYEATVCPHESAEENLTALRQRNYAPWDNGISRLRATFTEEHPQWTRACIDKANDLVKNRFTILDRQLTMDKDVDWHIDVLSGSSVPLKFWHDVDIWSLGDVSEVRYPWELNRHQDFMTLAKAYWLTRDEIYVRHLLSLWQDWLDHNPVHRGINWISPLEMALRIVSWTWTLYWIRTCPLLDAELYDRIIRFVGMQALFIERFLSKYSSANNHLIGEGLGLLYVGVFFPELLKSGQWRENGKTLLEQELIRQTTAEGWTLEQATGYHRYGLWYGLLAHFALLRIDDELQEQTTDRLQKMAQALVTLCDDRNCVPDLGDQDGGQAIRLSENSENPNTELFWAMAQVVPLELRSVPLQTESEAAWWLSGGNVYKPKINSPGRRRVCWAKAGYAIIDVGHDEQNQHMVFDAGPLGLGRLAAHGHADALSVWFSVGGQPVLIDSGTWLYLGAKKERDYFRSTMAHNTMVWNGISQSKIAGPFQWGRRTEPRGLEIDDDQDLSVRAEINEYAGQPVKHKRTVFFDQCWNIVDDISASGSGEVILLYHFSPDGHYTFDGEKLLAEFDSFMLTFHIKSGQDLQIEWHKEHEWGRYSPQFGVKQFAPLMLVRSNGEWPLTISTLIGLGGNRETKAL